jgi:predicted PurR-regulated permease PerM
VAGFVSQVFESLASGLSGIFGFFFGVFISVTLLYYILHDFDQVTAWLGSHIGLPQDLGAGVIEDAIDSMRGYFRGTTLTGVSVAIVIAVGTWLLGVPLAIPIGLVTFITCYIPYFGAIFSGAFAFVIALGTGGLPKAVALLIIVLVAQNVLQTVVSARFMGESLSLHPIVVLVVTMLGGTFAGLLGAALAAPLTALGVRTAARLRAYGAAGLLEETPEPDVATAGP